ncbi:MAG: hypothetical protein Q8O67_03895 [Deltaproteobacteria bacterium]|nr:hypothetical protein [Deltaproteobacteria bacterium]
MTHARGFSLPLVMTVLGALAAALGVLLVVITNSSANAASTLGRRQAFYACDGIARGVVELSHDYLKGTATPNSSDLRAAICDAAGGCGAGVGELLPGLVPAGFVVEDFQTVLVGARAPGTVPSGPFTGMNASLDEFNLVIAGRRTATNDRCQVTQVVSSADISLFQFFAWADGFLDIYSASAMDIQGRTHVNGDFCAAVFGAAASQRLSIDRLTASGSIFAAPNCPRFKQTSGNDPWFVGTVSPAASGLTSTQGVTSSRDHTRGDFDTFAPATWGNKLSDSKTGTTPLKFPIIGQPLVQDGRNASGTTINNSTSIRFIIDPRTAADDASVKEQRYACKADIRIINGVWYRRRPGSSDAECDWPGTPIWSDHAGRYSAADSVEEGIIGLVAAVGQEDLNGLLAGRTTLAPGSWAGAIPRRYSYYEYDTANRRIFNDASNTGVISYGSLIRAGNPATPSTTWSPGFWLADAVKADTTSTATTVPTRVSASDGYTAGDFVGPGNTTTFDDFRYCTIQLGGAATDIPTSPSIVDAATRACAGGVDLSPGDGNPDGATGLFDVGSNYLAATRSGFRDTRSAVTDAADEVLPINFDVAAFAAALADTTGDELGSYFGPGNEFNGIVYITSTWPGSRAGLGNNGVNPGTLATLAPDNGGNDSRDVNQVAAPFARTNLRAQRGLPYPLCSTTVGGVTPATTQTLVNRIPFSSSGGVADAARSPFSVPPCDGGANVNTSRPNALRVINARSLSAFPTSGLSIVTNLPTYVLGDFNAGSAVLANWRPAMIGGDSITYLSNAWQDQGSPWADGATTNMNPNRIPVQTNYFMAAIGGDVQTSATAWSGGLNNFPRFIERWSNSASAGAPLIAANITGSFVIGFRSVYGRQPFSITGVETSTYYPPLRTGWVFDTQFDTPTNQPPGAPSFSVDAVRTWRRE